MTKAKNLKEEDLRPIRDGEILAEALYISVDPYIRLFLPMLPIGSDVFGGQIARVVSSRDTEYPEGSIIYGDFGWRTHTIVNPKVVNENLQITNLGVYMLPQFDELPYSVGLGVLGMSGFTAYFGFLNYCKPKPGDIVVVTAAAGAVGMVVGQIAKIKGCSIIGICGSDDKCKYLKKELGFDYVINYKTQDVANELKVVAPDGVDCYFDNVGGSIATEIIQQMKRFGRIVCCGYISSYNTRNEELLPDVTMFFIGKELQMQGLQLFTFRDQFSDAISTMLEWIREGKLKFKETVTIGFEKTPKAFIEMLEGRNTGKAVVESVIFGS